MDHDLSEGGGRQAEQTLSIRMRSLPAAPLAYVKNQQYHHDLPAHDKNRGFFIIVYLRIMMSELKSPLHNMHKRLFARFVPFAGWSMPIQYASVIQEHLAVRHEVGVFDVSHMGEIEISGKRALDFLQRIMTNDLSKIQTGRCQYSPMLNEEGKTLDDLIINWVEEQRFILVVNASNKDKDYKWLSKQQQDLGYGDLCLEDRSSSLAMLAIQGPKAPEVISKIFGLSIAPFTVKKTEYQNQRIYFSGTGYTGEAGGEMILPWELAETVFEKLLDAGVTPCGLGARDSLRLEKGYCLYGHELNETTTPLDAGLGWTVGWNKNFLGHEVLKKQKLEKRHKALVGFILDRGAIARKSDKVFYAGEEIGHVTSGAFSPILKKAIGLARLESPVDSPRFEIDIRGRRVSAGKHKRVFVC